MLDTQSREYLENMAAVLNMDSSLGAPLKIKAGAKKTYYIPIIGLIARTCCWTI
jgi:hypothetical protein